MNENQYERCKKAYELLHGVQLELRREGKEVLARELFRAASDIFHLVFPFRPASKFFKERL